MSKNQSQQANGMLGPKANGNDYATARTELAREQAARQRQIRRQAAGELVDAADVRQILVTCMITHGAHLRGILKRVRAAHPGLAVEVYETLTREIEDAMAILSDSLRNMKTEKVAEDDEQA